MLSTRLTENSQHLRPDSSTWHFRSGNMGQHNTRSVSYKRTKFRRLTSTTSDQLPDVETLGFPFHVCHKLFVNLTLSDLAQCMLVCKEWRSMIDTCSFWKTYVRNHFPHRLVGPDKVSPLYSWKHNPTCLLTQGNNGKSVMTRGSSYVFKPFIEKWKCGIVVPSALTPVEGSVDIYHNLLQALCFLTELRQKLIARDLGDCVETCLFQWIRDRTPSPSEVLNIFNAHLAIIRTTSQAPDLTPGELLVAMETLSEWIKLDNDLMLWFSRRTTSKSVIVICDSHVIKPTPCFIITQISEGWFGGMLFALDHKT